MGNCCLDMLGKTKEETPPKKQKQYEPETDRWLVKTNTIK